MNAPALIPISTAQLPRTYEAAKRALSECSEVDECKDWADKAAALASYAKQSQDDQLERMAQRIRARAVRRQGELLSQFETAQGARNDLPTSVLEGQKLRSDAAREAGISPKQAQTAVRIASVPEAEFEAQVEAPKPATLTQLAQQGMQRRAAPPPDPQTWLKGRDPKAFSRALHFTGDITNYADAAAKWDLSVLHDLDDDQRMEIRNALRRIDATHDHIATRI
mgnify:CR=1 FL=1